MINYNMRYRGPYEYDKFALNVLQYSNAIYDFEHDIQDDKFFVLDSKIDKIFEESLDDDSLMAQVYGSLILMRGDN